MNEAEIREVLEKILKQVVGLVGVRLEAAVVGLKDCRAISVMASRTTNLAAVFPSVDNDILELQFAVVKKRNVKNKDKKISKRALPPERVVRA